MIGRGHLRKFGQLTKMSGRRVAIVDSRTLEPIEDAKLTLSDNHGWHVGDMQLPYKAINRIDVGSRSVVVDAGYLAYTRAMAQGGQLVAA